MFVARPVPMAFAGEVAKASPCSVPMLETAALTARMAKGDEEAFRQFYDSYAARLTAYLYVVTRGDESLSAELMQQTMIKVARSIRVFADNEALCEALWNWVATIARNCAADEERKRSRYSALLERFFAHLWPKRHDSGPELLMEQSLEDLSPEDQQLLRKKYLDGFSVKALARDLDLTEKAVESRLSRIREKIRQSISTARHS
jgi:RNA polymerase sigma-70 factor, ECF subfamily